MGWGIFHCIPLFFLIVVRRRNSEILTHSVRWAARFPEYFPQATFQLFKGSETFQSVRLSGMGREREICTYPLFLWMHSLYKIAQKGGRAVLRPCLSFFCFSTKQKGDSFKSPFCISRNKFLYAQRLTLCEDIKTYAQTFLIAVSLGDEIF